MEHTSHQCINAGSGLGGFRKNELITHSISLLAQ